MMTAMDDMGLMFTFPELIAVLGLTQSLVLLVYMLARAGRLEHAVIPCCYFLCLAFAFLVDFGQRHLAPEIPYYTRILTTAWYATIPFSLLVIRQVALIYDVPNWKQWLWVLTIPLLPLASSSLTAYMNTELGIWVRLLAVVFGSLALLSLWDTRGLFSTLYGHKLAGRERYWLCLSLILLNCGLLLFLAGGWGDEQLARGILGLGLIYVVSTCLFRIYPQAVRMRGEGDGGQQTPLNDTEKGLAARIESLFALDKVYQEATYGRADLARELDIPEAQLSRIINLHFARSLPQVLNDYRVRDAARMLAETDAPVKQIAADVGFNSMASFNRVFKDVTGKNPSEFRALGRNVA